VTNDVVITDAIRFVQQSEGRLKASKEEEKREKLMSILQTRKNTISSQRNMIIMTKILNCNGNKKNR
jgi:hypothetical protein